MVVENRSTATAPIAHSMKDLAKYCARGQRCQCAGAPTLVTADGRSIPAYGVAAWAALISGADGAGAQHGRRNAPAQCAATALLGQALLPHLVRIVPAPEPLGAIGVSHWCSVLSECSHGCGESDHGHGGGAAGLYAGHSHGAQRHGVRYTPECARRARLRRQRQCPRACTSRASVPRMPIRIWATPPLWRRWG